MSKFFRTHLSGTHTTERYRRVYSSYEKPYTLNDFFAAVYFLSGSILFLYESLMIWATWGFIIGSAHFMLRPTIKLAREFHLTRLPFSGAHESH